MKKALSMLVLVALLLTTLIVYVAAEPVTILFQSWDPQSKYQPVLDAYHAAQSNVVVEYEQVPDYLTKIFTEAASDALPDLISCQVGYTQVFADAGIIDVIDVEALKADESFNFDDFWDTTLAYASYEGKLYGLPVDGGNYVWVYNKKMLDEANIIVPEEGFSWDEFIEVLQKLTVRDENGKVTRYATMLNDLGLKNYLPYIWQNGAQYLNEDGTKCLLGEAAAVEAIQWVKDLSMVYDVMPSLEKQHEGTLPIVGMLNSGAIAMGRVGLWESLQLDDSNVLEWMIMPAPYNKARGEILYVNTLSVASTSEKKDAALDFLKFICSEEGESILLKNTSDPQIACRKSLKDLAISPLPEGKNAIVYMDSLDYCTWMPNVLTVNEQLEVATRELDRIWYGNEDVAMVMQDLASQIDELL